MELRLGFKVFEFMKIVSELWDYLIDLKFFVFLYELFGNKKVCVIF